MLRRFALGFFLIPVVTSFLSAADLELAKAVVVSPSGISGPEKQAVKLLVEEVAKRSWVEWQVVEAMPASSQPAIVVGPADVVRNLVPQVPIGQVGKEGFRIGIVGSIVYVAGDDHRGTLFGVGRLLRELRIHRESVTLPENFAIATAPQTLLRGHQIGYRPKTNSYDGWTIPMWEQYIRDLIVFGCNAIEIIPPRSDDDADSPLFPNPPLRTMTAVSKIADSYGLDVWIWYPAMDKDYTNANTVEASLKEWGDVFKALPRVDAVFVPGGDPGHTPPKVLFPFLEKQTENLKAIHPKAQMWVSPQGFNKVWYDDFVTLMKADPVWLSGVVHGPQVRVDLPTLRADVPKKFPIRDYPDITHNRSCQYPVHQWNYVQAHTIGREGVNPRPRDMMAIYLYAQPHTNGFITYSEGCHDDVNKMLWSALGWGGLIDMDEILKQYGRYFIGPKLGDRFAQALAGLEENWDGNPLHNKEIVRSIERFQTMERDSGPAEKRNWRFQQSLYRAYFDAAIQKRLTPEQKVRDEYVSALRKGTSLDELNNASSKLFLFHDSKSQLLADRDLEIRTGELAEALFQSIHAQLSVKKYHAIAVHRGANLDGLRLPLTDVSWISEMTGAKELDWDARRRLILNREDPGPGGFYDDLGNPAKQPHLVRGKGKEKDPAYYHTAQEAFYRGPVMKPLPRAWWDYIETHYDHPLRLHYPEVDRKARYKVRVVYADADGVKSRLFAGDHQLHGYDQKAWQSLEFDIPAEATAKGELTLTWEMEPGIGGNGRGCQVCEVFVIKK
jgi:hypothetical protein